MALMVNQVAVKDSPSPLQEESETFFGSSDIQESD